MPVISVEAVSGRVLLRNVQLVARDAQQRAHAARLCKGLPSIAMARDALGRLARLELRLGRAVGEHGSERHDATLRYPLGLDLLEAARGRESGSCDGDGETP